MAATERERGHASWRVDERDATVVVSGAWVLDNVEDLAAVETTRLADRPHRVDATAVTALDTAGALLIVRALRQTGVTWDAHRVEGLGEAHERLLDLVATGSTRPAEPVVEPHGVIDLIVRVGVAMERYLVRARELLGFVGRVVTTLTAMFVGRRKLRMTATVYHMEQTGLDAVPIVFLLSFAIGAVVAFLGTTVLREFGAEVYTVELVSFSVLREFGVLLTAILLAGRSGSAFTAQIGSMMSREEVDAIKTLGLDPVELLVIPRLLALVAMLPALTFIAMCAGILGGGMMASVSLDLTSAMFISRLRETMELRHFFTGISKAPFFAFIIAVVGCLEGFRVEGSAESVGRHTTSSVVQSIFLVILVDALFAMWFMERGW